MALVIAFFLPMIDTFGIRATNIICASAGRLDSDIVWVLVRYIYL